jgi:HrpA-like RNA helicase
MDFACASSQNVLLVSPPGSGKTALINDFLSTQGGESIKSKYLNIYKPILHLRRIPAAHVYQVGVLRFLNCQTIAAVH